MIKCNIIILSLLLLSGCSKKIIQPAVIEKTIVKDSIIELVRDSVITLPADSSYIKALLECDSLGQVHIKELLSYKAGEKQQPPVITVEKNVLTALSRADSMSIYMQLKDRYREVTTDKVIHEKEIVEVNKLTKFQQFWMMLGRMAGLFCLMFIAFRIRKVF